MSAVQFDHGAFSDKKVISKTDQSEVFNLLSFHLSTKAAYACFFEVSFCFSFFFFKTVAATRARS